MINKYNQHIHGWLEKIEANVAKFKEKQDASQDDKIEFITHQYHLVMLINRALNGQVIFVGAKPIEEVTN